ncbi:hypothetical protein MPL1_09290 [Methylophaga lonarensis MPL]|uniref:Uncharacterized protein n=1 Tax=Methylophaga lonarensis MPL TaxID=1286106 RepID=M7NZJ9_9GAMM|nr:hypothetical protein [Methylophaga lonarensis]EMR12662.1 hypothetical protein MPL1_09290 [Methylophaga lonarensis MPL]
MNKLSTSLFAAAMIAIPSLAAANDFSTMTRVQYVQECVQSNPHMNLYESTNKCSCVIDEIAKEYNQVEFDDAAASYKYRNMVADRGRTVRQNSREAVSKFEKVLLTSYETCKMRPNNGPQ